MGPTTKARRAQCAVALVLMAALAGCAPAGEEPDPGGTSGTATASPQAPTGSAEDPAPTTEQPSVDARTEDAVQDLAERLGIPPADVTVVRTAEVTWPDGSLGCPTPGMSYTQALVDGMLIELAAAGETYTYHSGADGDPFLCEDPQQPVGTDR